jgi:hypothetical protein
MTVSLRGNPSANKAIKVLLYGQKTVGMSHNATFFRF